MPLWIHIYRDSAGRPCGETGFAESHDEAMEWLQEFNAGFERAGYQYERTIAVQDAGLAEVSYATHQHLLSMLPEWERERSREYNADRKHEGIELRALRNQQL